MMIDFLQGINRFEANEKLFNVLASYGLPLNIQKEGLIAMVIPKDLQPKTRYHQFYIIADKEKTNKSEFEYDIPYYMEDIPSNYAVFSTVEEKDRLVKYLNQSISTKDSMNITSINKSKKTKKTKDLFQTPKPFSENSYCNLCKIKYKEYYAHINSQFHLQTIDRNIEIYCRITDTFTRITNYWKNKNENKKDISSLLIQPIKQQQCSQQQEDLKKELNIKRRSERSIENTIRKYREKNKEIMSSNKVIIQKTLMIEDKSVIISQQETQLTQYNTNISKNTERKQIETSLNKIYKKKKYCDLIEDNCTLLDENKRYLRSRNPLILHKLNKCIKKLSKG